MNADGKIGGNLNEWFIFCPFLLWVFRFHPSLVFLSDLRKSSQVQMYHVGHVGLIPVQFPSETDVVVKDCSDLATGREQTCISFQLCCQWQSPSKLSDKMIWPTENKGGQSMWKHVKVYIKSRIVPIIALWPSLWVIGAPNPKLRKAERPPHFEWRDLV